MRTKDSRQLALIRQALVSYTAAWDVPGLEDDAAVESLARQIIESQRRIDFVRTISARPISDLRADPSSCAFDPIRAAVLNRINGHVDEAAWLVFLATHFGHNIRDKWRLAKDVYGGLGTMTWTWNATSLDVNGFRDWLHNNQDVLRGGDGVSRRFGNHRKYTSLNARKPNGTGDAVSSYVNWVMAAGGHRALFDSAMQYSTGDEGLAFDVLYGQMKIVSSFGRIGRFDYLTMIGKTGIASIRPPSPYLVGATGPLHGAKLLFGGGKSTSAYESMMIKLGNHLGYNMQVMEDSICNWQKSPLQFKPFRG